MRVHNWVALYDQLRWMGLANGGWEIAQHDPSIKAGDRILWGASVEQALGFDVVRVTRQIDVADQWIVEMHRARPDIYISGQRITQEQSGTKGAITKNLPNRLLK